MRVCLLGMLSLLSVASAWAQRPYTDEQVIAYAKAIDVKTLDASLPSQRLEDWLQGGAVQGHVYYWRVADTCDLKPVDSEKDYPLCAKIAVGRSREVAYFLLQVGTYRTGIARTAHLHGNIYLIERDAMTDTSREGSRLSEIPGLLEQPAVAGPKPAVAVQEGQQGSARALFCAYGSVGFIPARRPPGFESEFAVAVVEISSPVAVVGVSVSDFVLFDRQGTIPMKRVTDEDVFEAKPFTQARAGNLGSVAYYLNPGPGSGTHARDGTLPARTIRLRIRVALQGVPDVPDRFRIRVGTYVIEGRVDAAWPT